MSDPDDLAAALRLVRGQHTAEKPRPACMVAAIEAARAVQPAPRPARPAAPVVRGADGDGIPAIRALTEAHRNGRR